MSVYTSLRPFLFSVEAERMHRGALSACRIPGASRVLGAACRFEDPRLASTVAGLRFANPIGLGAGFDKNGVAVETLARLGFGALEVGSVSAAASAGNRAPVRLLRLPEEEALVVYYGVPNDGAPVVGRRLARIDLPLPLGVSLVETNTGGRPAPLDALITEMRDAARIFVPIADYLALNLSCPNTSGGAGALEDLANLPALLEALQALPGLPPLFLKIRPPEDPRAIEAVLKTVDRFERVKGFMLNVHVRRPELPGALTGRPLRQPAEKALREWYARIDRRRHVLIAAGGIADAEDAYRYLQLGASLVQLVTALVYRGPRVVKRIKRGLCDLLERDGLRSINEAVGTACTT